VLKFFVHTSLTFRQALHFHQGINQKCLIGDYEEENEDEERQIYFHVFELTN